MPAKTIGIVLGLFGVLAVTIFILLGRDPRAAARSGSLVKRRLLTTGLAVLAMLGAGSTGCKQGPGKKAGPHAKPPVEAPPSAPVRAEMNLDGTRFGPRELDTINQPSRPDYKPAARKLTTVETIFADFKKPKKKPKRERTTCYIIRLPTNRPSLATPVRILERMHLIHKLMATHALSEKTLDKILSGIDRLIDKLDRE